MDEKKYASRGVTLEPELPDTRAPCDVRALPWAEAHGFLFSHGHGLGLTSTDEVHSPLMMIV